MTTFYRRLPRFDYVQPASLDEALSLLGRYKAEAKPLAGGTDLIPQVKRREMSIPRILLDLKGIHGLDSYHVRRDKRINPRRDGNHHECGALSPCPSNITLCSQTR